MPPAMGWADYGLRVQPACHCLLPVGVRPVLAKPLFETVLTQAGDEQLQKLLMTDQPVMTR